TVQRSASQLFLDGKEIITNDRADVLQEGAQQDLAAGWHDIRISFQCQDTYATTYLYWTPPGGSRSIIPSRFLWPVLGQYPTDVKGLSLDQTNSTALPPDRVTHVPPREGEVVAQEPVAPPPSQGQAQTPTAVAQAQQETQPPVGSTPTPAQI